MDNVSFSMHFYGQAVENNSIDVAYLAPTLLRLEDLIKVTAQELYESEFRYSIHVQAFAPGSFRLEFGVRKFMSSSERTLNSKEISAALHLLEVLGFVSSMPFMGTACIGLALLVMYLSKRKVINEEDIPGAENLLKITLDNGKILFALKDAYCLYNNVVFRVMYKELLHDLLNKDGIDAISFGTNRNATTSITKEYALCFYPSEMDAMTLIPDGVMKLVRPVKISFVANRKWQMADNISTFSATMKDEEFMKRVAAGLPISAMDHFVVLLRDVQKKTSKGQQKSLEILKVLRYRQKDRK